MSRTYETPSPSIILNVNFLLLLHERRWKTTAGYTAKYRSRAAESAGQNMSLNVVRQPWLRRETKSMLTGSEIAILNVLDRLYTFCSFDSRVP